MNKINKGIIIRQTHIHIYIDIHTATVVTCLHAETQG